MIAWLLAVSLGMSTAPLPVEPVAAEGTHALPAPGQVLAIPSELHDLLQQRVVDRSPLPQRRLELLVDFMFSPDGLGLEYRHDATYTVEEAYRARTANCLTFTLLTIAMAREVGLDAYGQEVREVLSWQQQDDNIVLSNHVNAGIRIQQRRLTVDVARDDIIALDPPRRISDAQLLAMFYNNLAMASVLRNAPDAAVPYITASLELDPASATGWNNLGVVQLRRGDSASAEDGYLRALELEPSHLGALANLATLYRQQGRNAQAGTFEKRSRKALLANPFHQFMSGHDAEKRGDLAQAIKHYRQAIRLHRSEYRFHAALARAYLHAGNTRAAGRALEDGSRYSDPAQRDRYLAKLASIKRKPAK